MRFLVEGTGSIGQRHYRNARTLGHEVAFLRTSTSMRPFVQEFFDTERKEGREPLVFTNLKVAIDSFKPDALIVSNPNHLHAASALEGAKHGLHLFIEKPVNHSSEGLVELAQIVEEKKLAAMVGYNLRFHPLLERLKSLIDGGELGTILSAHVEVGENIVDWHPWEDYRETYAPYIKSGGGSLLCFSHDIDYLYWLLGAPKEVFAGGGKITLLAGDAEDMVQTLWRYGNGTVATLHIDYFQRPKVRTLKIIGSKMTAVWDAYGALDLYDAETGEKRTEEAPKGFERNDMFLAQFKDFVHSIETGTPSRTPLSQGAEVLAIVDRIKEALT